MSTRRKLTEKLQERTTLLEKAEGLLQEGNQEEYQAQMDLVKSMNRDIQELQELIQEQDRKFMEKAADPAEERDKAEERGSLLMKGQEVKFSALEVSKALFLPQSPVEKSVTLATGTLAQPTGAGTNIRDPLGSGVGAIIDQVYVQDLTGMSSYLEPYVISEFDATGGDLVRFLMSANAGEAPGRISRIASGGELARIMLVMKDVLTERAGPDTLVFDEIDEGISGIAAQRVAEKLAHISRRKQVICVTHLPQIAAMADTHFHVEKRERGGRTYTAVTVLDRDGRIREIARLHSGDNITDTTLKSAEEQLDAACAYKEGGLMK